MKTPQTHQDTVNLLDWYLQWYMSLAIVQRTVTDAAEYTAICLKMLQIEFLLESLN